MGATIKIMLNPTRNTKDGKRALVLRLTINRKRTYLSLGYFAHEKDWSEENSRFNKSFDPLNYKEINVRVKNFNTKAINVINDIEKEGREVTFESFSKRFFQGKSASNVFDFFDKTIDGLKIRKQIGNAIVYKQTRSALLRYSNNNNLQFSDIDVGFLNRWETFLSKTCTGNGISNYMRTLRALYNKAISEELCKRDCYPFKNPYNPNGYNLGKLKKQTIKRALTKVDIQKIIKYKPKKYSSIYDAKNIFLFSYYNMGMNFVDMAYLQWKNIYDGRINYVRKKTKKKYSIKIMQPVQIILDYYKKFAFDNDYVFPVLNDFHKTEEQKKTRVMTALKKINADLKTIRGKIKLDNDFVLSTYVARHSWATILKKQGISTSLISEGLGHTDEKTTQVYLDSFENSALDIMNSQLLVKMKK